MTAPLLVMAVGNASRGDDALGPALVDALRRQGWDRDDGIELLEDFQLQPEHALDLDGRRAVLFVDASRVPLSGGAQLQPIAPDDAAAWTTHALAPQALLAIYERVQQRPAPPAWLLAIEGRAFELGEPLGDAARAHLARAVALACAWRQDLGNRTSDGPNDTEPVHA